MNSKLNALFDDVTILNFKFVFKLLKRYRKITILVPFLVLGLSAYFYKNQNQIHSGSISFRYLPDSKSSPVTLKSALVAGSEASLDSSEILGIVNSTNFLQKIAKDIFSDPELNKLDFNSIFTRKKLSFEDYVSACKSDDCKLAFIRKKLPSFVEFVEDDIVLNKYIVTVKTLSRKTTDKIIKYVAQNVKEYRMETINFQLEKQIEIAEKLLRQEELKLTNLDAFKTKEQKDLLQSEMKAIQEKSKNYNGILEEKKIALEKENISLKYTKSTLKKEVSPEQKKKWKKIENLQLGKELLLADITALEHSIGGNSKQDDLVIKDLKQELEKINREIANNEGAKTSSLLEKFKDKKLQSKGLIEFNINVLKDHITSLTKITEKLKIDMDILISKLAEKEEFLKQHKAKFDYFELLQGKLLQIKLVKDTVVSDLIFDDYLESSRRYKKYKLTAIIPFAMILIFFLTLFVIILRYVLDPRIMDEEEFKVIFKDIPFIGEIPDLD